MRHQLLAPTLIVIAGCAAAAHAPPTLRAPPTPRPARPPPAASAPAAETHAPEIPAREIHARAIADVVETAPCPRDQQRTSARDVVFPAGPAGGCGQEPVYVILVFCGSTLRLAEISDEVFGNNGSRALYFDASGRLLVVADQAHGSLWLNEYFSYLVDDKACMLGGSDEWDEEAVSAPPEPSLVQRLLSRGPCDMTEAWPRLPYDQWSVPTFDAATCSFDATSLAEDIALIRHLLAHPQ